MALGLAAYSATVFTVSTATSNPFIASPVFSPAAGDVIYCVGFVDDSAAQLTENTPTNTGTALTWTLVARANAFLASTLTGVVSVWRAFNVSAQTSITATYGCNSGTASPHAGVCVIGFTGADSAQTGAVSSSKDSTSTTTAATTPALTTSQPGSWCWMNGMGWSSFTTLTPPGGQATQCPAQDPGSGDTVWMSKESGQPASNRAAGTVVTMSGTFGAANSYHAVAWEVIPAGAAAIKPSIFNRQQAVMVAATR